MRLQPRKAATTVPNAEKQPTIEPRVLMDVRYGVTRAVYSLVTMMIKQIQKLMLGNGFVLPV